MERLFSLTRALVARKRKIFALFFALAASIGLSWAANPSGECGDNLTWELDETTGALTISGTGTMLDNPSWRHEDLNSRITSVSLPEGLTDIGPYIFADCEKLESITLPSGLTSIDIRAFMNCRALREITLPGSLTTLGEQAFFYCRQLESIKLPEGITTLGNDVFANCDQLRSVTLPPTLTSIGERAFNNCGRLESITLPDGLTSIGSSAFSGCHYIESITLPEGVTSIGSRAFEYCGFESIKLPEGITTLGNGVFSNCDRLQSVTLPPTLTSIGDWAFSGCWNLASVTLPESVTSIGAHAFSDCGVTSMTLPAGVTTIGEEAFAYCKSLTEFTNKAATPQTISANVFSDVTLSNITLNVPGTSKAAYEAADVWKDFGTKAAIPAAITKTITDNGMTYDIYDNGVVKVSGTGIVAARIFAANDHDYVPSVKRFEFADDCKVYSFGEDWYMYYTSNSPLETVDIKTTLPFVAGRESVFYRKEDGSDESVTVTITAPAIASINREFVDNYGTPQHIIFNTPVTTFEKGWCNYLSEKDTVTIPTGSLYHLPASYAFKDEYKQYRYDDMVADGMEDGFWKYEASGLVEGVDYTRTEEKTGVITAENDSIVFGKAVVKYQAPQEAPATSWTFWRLDDLRTFPELENGSSHTCKDVTLKIVDGSFINMSGIFIRLSTSATNGIQLIAPKGKIFKQVIALDRDLRTSLIWTGEADTVGISSSLMEISLIEFELDAAPANPAADAQAAIDSINAIPDPVVYTEECKAKIDAARATLDALSDEARALLTEADTIKLPQAEAAYAGLLAEKVAPVIAAIDAIPSPIEDNLKLSAYDKVKAAREAYDALATDEEKAAVDNYDKLTAAEAAFAAIGGGGAPAGALSGKYTINDGGDVIYFAHGNLQYTRENLDADWSTGTFRLAENQYDLIELVKTYPAAYCTDNYGDKTAVGLFGWGTWGEGKTPNLTSSDRSLYTWSTDFSGTLEGTDTWRTLTKDEWVYLLTHNNQSYATVHGVNGLLVAPDGKDIEGKSMTAWVEINDETWTTMQNDGYLFLPACGQRSQISGANITTGGQGTEILYYSSTEYSDVYAYNIWYKPGQDPAADDHSNKRQAFGIRLVSAGVNPLDQAQAAVALIHAIPDSVVYTDACKETIDAARAAVDALGENASLIDDEDMAILTAAEARYEYLENRPTPSFNPAPAAIENLKYTGTAQALITAGVPDYGTILYSLNGADYSEKIPTALNYGSYPVYYKVLETEEHKAFGPVQITASILKADPVFTAPTANSRTYDGSRKALLTMGETQDGHLEYMLTPDDEDGWSAETPYASAAGTYNVYYRLVGDDNHNSFVAQEPVVVKIAPAALTATAENKTVTYGDAVPAYTVTYAGWVNGENESVLTGEIAYACEYTAASDAAEYDITPSGVSAANYEITFVNGKLTVNKADAVFTAPKAVKGLVYTSEKQALITAGECADGTFLYSLDNTNWVDTLPEVLNAATYTVYYKVQGDANHNDYIAEEPITVTIAKAALTITAESKEVVYGFAAPGFSVSYSGLKGSDLPADVLTGELSYACDYTVGSNAGEYDITPGGQTSANYDITFVKGKLVVYKADPAFTAPTANTLTYNGGAQTLIAAGITEHGTFEYTFTPNDEESWNIALPQAKNADTYGVYYRVVGDANHNDYESADAVVVTIAKAALTATADDKSVIYGDAVPTYTVTYEGWQGEDDETVLTGTIAYACEYAPTSNVSDYTITPSGVSNPDYTITFVNGKVTVSKAALTITAEDKSVIYGDEVPEHTAQFEGFKNEDDELELDVMSYTCAYEQGSPVGTYVITPVAEDINYEITVVPATLTVNKAVVKVSGAEAQIAKIESGTTDAVVLNAGTLDGIKLSDPIGHETTASFSDATVGENKTITLFYELTGDAALLANYDLIPTSEIFTSEGVIIEDFIPAEEGETEKEDDEAQIEEGIEVYAYGYCDGSGYSLRYHLNSGNPDQYKIDFDDPRFTDVDWTNLVTPGKDGTIDIEIPVDLPTGDYTFTATFRDSRFPWLESDPFTVTFHVNLPETYVTPLFGNVIALVDTCNCFTDIQWYHRADASEAWQPIAGATGHYYRPEGGAKLTGEFFVKASMNGEPTYTCGQSDMETLYGAERQQPKATVKAFPNPVVNTTTVTIENSEKYDHSLRIVNMMGIEVMNDTFEGNETTVDMGGYTTGNYMISVDGIVVKVMKK